MCLGNENKEKNTLMMTGMVFLVIANLTRGVLDRLFHAGDGVTDGVYGLLLGVAITCLLMSVRAKARRRSGDEP